MFELIQELKNNKKIKNTSTVNIDYIIGRLEDINILEEYIKNEIIFNIENLVNEDYPEKSEDAKKLENLNNNDIEKICNNLIKNDWLISAMNETLNESITDELYHYINDIK